MATVTVLILARNEEKFIGACIDSVHEIADEILIIDDGSTDQTAAIAKSKGAKVIAHALNGNWGAQQTFAIEQANGDWVLFIDADERATPELRHEIREKVNQDDRTKAYATARLSFFWGQPLKHGGWFPDYVVRLFPRKDSYVTGFVHPKIHHTCQEIKLRDWDHYFNKLNFYTTLAAKKAKSEGKSASVLDMIMHPFWASFRMYFLRGGFLDGKIGFILASFHFFYTMAKYVKLYYLDKDNSHD